MIFLKPCDIIQMEKINYRSESGETSKMKIGIDLGGSHIAIGVVDNKGKILEKVEKRITGTEKNNIKNVIEEYIFEKAEGFISKYKITEIGIAIPGTVENGIVVKSVNLGLKNYEIVKNLQNKIDLPIKIRNDAKCAALAENVYGTLKGYNRSIFLTLGTGIGGAVIIDNKLLDTGGLPGCEFGHMIIEKNGRLCKCGKKGCWEKYASMKAFKDELRKILKVDERTSGKELLDILRKLELKGKEQCKENSNSVEIKQLIEDYIYYLSIGISNLVNIFEPEAIGIGGSFVFYEEIFLEKLKRKILEDKLLFNERKELIIQTAILDNDAGLIGATL